MSEPLRPVDPGEVETLADLWHRGWTIGHQTIVPPALLQYRDRDSFRDRILNSLETCFVIGPIGAITGFVRLKGDELDQFYVAENQIGTGQARHLMVAAEALMASRGVRDAFLIASVGNARALRFYARMGWHDVGVQQAAVETESGPFEMAVHRLEKTLDPT